MPKGHEPQMIDANRVKTGELADILGVNPETIRLRKMDGVFKDLGAGKYNLADAVQAYFEYQNNGRVSTAQAEAKRRTESERARKYKLENDLVEGKLLPLDEVVSAFSSALIVIRQHVSAIGARVSGEVAGINDADEIRQIIKKETDDALISCETSLKDVAGVGGHNTADPSKENAQPE